MLLRREYMAHNKHLIDVSATFSILPVKTSGLGTQYAIWTLPAKFSVLKSRVPYLQGVS